MTLQVNPPFGEEFGDEDAAVTFNNGWEVNSVIFFCLEGQMCPLFCKVIHRNVKDKREEGER